MSIRSSPEGVRIRVSVTCGKKINTHDFKGRYVF